MAKRNEHEGFKGATVAVTSLESGLKGPMLTRRQLLTWGVAATGAAAIVALWPKESSGIRGRETVVVKTGEKPVGAAVKETFISLAGEKEVLTKYNLALSADARQLPSLMLATATGAESSLRLKNPNAIDFDLAALAGEVINWPYRKDFYTDPSRENINPKLGGLLSQWAKCQHPEVIAQAQELAGWYIGRVGILIENGKYEEALMGLDIAVRLGGKSMIDEVAATATMAEALQHQILSNERDMATALAVTTARVGVTEGEMADALVDSRVLESNLVNIPNVGLVPVVLVPHLPQWGIGISPGLLKEQMVAAASEIAAKIEMALGLPTVEIPGDSEQRWQVISSESLVASTRNWLVEKIPAQMAQADWITQKILDTGLLKIIELKKIGTETTVQALVFGALYQEGETFSVATNFSDPSKVGLRVHTREVTFNGAKW